MTATTTYQGQAIDLSGTGAQFKWASFYTSSSSERPMVKVHRTEAAAFKGQWDSKEMRKVWTKAGHAPIVHN